MFPVSWHLLSLQMCVLVFQHFRGFLEGSVLGRSSLKMPRNGVKNKHGPVSEFQSRALFSGRWRGQMREMSGISQSGGSGVSGHWVTPNGGGTEDKGSFLVSHNCSHRALSFWGAVWSLSPSAPHTKGPGTPSPVPKSPFSLLEESSCPSSHLLLATFGFGVFCCFFLSSRAQSEPPHCPGGSSTQSAFKHLLFDL